LKGGAVAPDHANSHVLSFGRFRAIGHWLDFGASRELRTKLTPG
jgi:hypothetical protein